MYEITVEAVFSAAHALSIAGTREPLHGHNWRVTATLAGPRLDADGLLCDFHTVQDVLQGITDEFDNRNLNDAAPFNDGVNPSAENVARHIADELMNRLVGLDSGVTLAGVSVTEAPGCTAAYRPA